MEHRDLDDHGLLVRVLRQRSIETDSLRSRWLRTSEPNLIDLS